ncbi:MAG: response regulator [Oscillospiraceae bacterium]
MGMIKIMICDDSILVRKKFRDFVATLGCEILYEASDGVEAVAKYKEFQPDLVFMDIVMPNKTGVEALTEIMEYDNKARVVIASSVGTQSHLKKAIEAGAYDFLQKPIENEQVKKIILNAIKGEK